MSDKEPSIAYKIVAPIAVVFIMGLVLLQGYTTYHAAERAPANTVEKVERKTYTVDWIAEKMIYTRDEKTGLCFAGPPINHSNTSFTMVPCTEKVLQAIKERGLSQ